MLTHDTAYRTWWLALVLLLTAPAHGAAGQAGSFLFQGRTRTFEVHVPPGYTGSSAVPLVLALHGGFGSAAAQQHMSQLSVKADSAGFIVVYPEGMANLAGIRTWNAGDCCGPAVTAQIDDVGFLVALLDTLARRYRVDQSRVYATGMSNGGMMAYRLACEHPGRVAAIAPVACSLVYPSCRAGVRAVPVMHFHSYLDTNVRYGGGLGTGPSGVATPPVDSVLNAWAAFDSCIVRNDTLHAGPDYLHKQWREGRCGAIVEAYVTHDGGHSWPGGRRSSAMADVPSQVVDANDLMWAFFQRFTTAPCVTTGQEPAPRAAEVRLTPNPADRIWRLTLPPGGVGWRVHDLLARKTAAGRIAAGQTDVEIRVEGLPPGVYSIEVEGRGWRATRRGVVVGQ